ncbi:peptidoglycan D,D-transpeptidase FtsI family protein [Parasutterella secunda]|uniref:Peptidoglycan D,D-transpeptidase FtsI n=1 Tax=Parasutterella secunda TaxID=626947 RepID=A0ABS2GRG3_9BURK|nr:penicillin-binding protein 2 [Parasutterella secunda]MBM6928375.1 penicillin-binding protein 2 [Parasutterella secunda]
MTMREPLSTRVFNFLRKRFHEFWSEDTTPRMPKRSKEREKEWLALEISQKRSHVVLGVLVGIFVVCFLRAGYLQCFNTEFLQKQGEVRYARTLEIAAGRGQIFDRNGVVLAATLPARSIWATTNLVTATPAQLSQLSDLLGVSETTLKKRLSRKDAFVNLARQVDMDVVRQVQAMHLEGLTYSPDVKRHYPGGEVSAHIVGFNNREDHGQEGVELANDRTLTGKNGARRVIRDRLGHVIEEMWTQEPVPGQDLHLSIDSRIQYIAYSAVKNAVEKHQAKAGAVVVADSITGEILALVSWPGFDPNDRSTFVFEKIRNRVVTDTYEPGSIMKPFAIAKALDMGIVRPDSLIQTAPGKIRVADRTISDTRDFGLLRVSQVIAKSSNVGTVKIALQIPPEVLWETYSRLGFGQAPQVGFPGAVAGRLRPAKTWGPVEQATISYGYGLSTSLMQIAQAYTVFARNGDVIPLTLMKQDHPAVGEQVYRPEIARQMRAMMMTTVHRGGTASRLKVTGYTVAGKTGTVYKVKNGEYVKDYVASFVGVAPATQPRLVVAVMIDEPKDSGHVGGVVAAPVFGEVVEAALRTLLVNPDDPMMVAGGGLMARTTH